MVERGKTSQPTDEDKNEKIWNDHQASLDLDSSEFEFKPVKPLSEQFEKPQQ